MNSQIVSLNQALRSYQTFYLVVTAIAVSIFLPAGFISVSIIWFFALSLYNMSPPTKWQRLNPLILPILLFALNLPWIFLSVNESATVDLIFKKIHLLLIPAGFIFVDKYISDRAFHFILTLFLVCSLSFSLLCLGGAFIEFLNHKGGAVWTSHFTGSNLSEIVNISPAYLSMFLNLAFLITLLNPFVGLKGKVAIGLYLATFIILLLSLPGIIALAVTSFLSLQATNRKIWTRIILGGSLILAFIIILNFYATGNAGEPDYAETEGEIVNSMPARLVIWSYAMKTGYEKPLTGHGSGLGQTALEHTYESEKFFWGARESLNPHNQFLSTYLDLGLVGLVFLLIVLIYPFAWSLRKKDFLLMAYVVMMVLFFCFESVLVRQKGIVFFAYFYSLIFSNSLRPTSRN